MGGEGKKRAEEDLNLGPEFMEGLVYAVQDALSYGTWEKVCEEYGLPEDVASKLRYYEVIRDLDTSAQIEPSGTVETWVIGELKLPRMKMEINLSKLRRALELLKKERMSEAEEIELRSLLGETKKRGLTGIREWLEREGISRELELAEGLKLRGGLGRMVIVLNVAKQKGRPPIIEVGLVPEEAEWKGQGGFSYAPVYLRAFLEEGVLTVVNIQADLRVLLGEGEKERKLNAFKLLGDWHHLLIRIAESLAREWGLKGIEIVGPLYPYYAWTQTGEDIPKPPKELIKKIYVETPWKEGYRYNEKMGMWEKKLEPRRQGMRRAPAGLDYG